MERHRRMLLSSLASAAAKIISVSTALISIPLTLRYLGPERYGVWLTISSLIAILSFADLGIGNGLLNRVASANGRDDRDAIRRYVSSAFVVLAGIAGVILLGFWASYALIPWDRAFNVNSAAAAAEVGPAMAVFATCFAFAIPAAIVQKVQIGLQGGFTASLWQCLGSLLALAAIFVATRFEGGLPWLVLAYLGAPLTVAILNSLVFFGRQQVDIAPRFSAFSSSAARQTAQTGVLFLILQIVSAAAYSSDALVISHLLGPAAVPQYAVPDRLFSMVSALIAMGLAPLWPAYGEAISRTDRDWVRRTFLRSLFLSLGIAAAAAGGLFLLAPTLVTLWVGPSIQPTTLLLAGLALWRVIEAGGNAAAMLLNGAGVVRFQVIVSLFTGGVILTLKFVLVSRIGVAGSIWASVIGFLLVAAIPLIFRMAKVLDESPNGAK